MDSKLYKLLLVDDSATILHGISRLLQEDDTEIDQVQSAEQGLELIGQKKYDLIISDFQMPGLNGVQFCQEIKKQGYKIPLIMISSFNDSQLIKASYDCGSIAFINKNRIKEELFSLVRKTLRNVSFNKRKTILLADDSRPLLHILSDNLESIGFNVLCAENGRQAIELLQKNTIDLILCDLRMPEMDGVQVLQFKNSNSPYQRIPFLVISTFEDRQLIMEMKNQGADGYLVKPLNPDELVFTVERTLYDHDTIVSNENRLRMAERGQMISSITSLVMALEARDKYTRGHSEQVAQLMQKMAKKANFSEEMREEAEIGGKLHDIGKIGIQDKVLLKPGALDPDELSHIKEHPLIGYNILSSVQFFQKIIPIVKFHHERFDGKGYPFGLKGPAIPFLARMASVADAYDALNRDRPYRKGMSKENALEIIRNNKGSQFCPDAVELFMSIID